MSQNRQTKPTTDIITINKLKATGKRQFFIDSLKKLLSSLPFLSQKRIQQFTLYLKIPKKHSPLEESWNHTTAHRCDHDSCSCRHLKDKSSVKAAAAPRLVKCADKVKKERIPQSVFSTCSRLLHSLTDVGACWVVASLWLLVWKKRGEGIRIFLLMIIRT